MLKLLMENEIRFAISHRFCRMSTFCSLLSTNVNISAKLKSTNKSKHILNIVCNNIHQHSTHDISLFHFIPRHAYHFKLLPET